jgi:phosphocarrier protein
MTTCVVRISNSLGLHARAAARFVHAASAFQSRIRVAKGDQEMDGKSIMGLLLLTAAQGTSVTISADGVDELDAITTLRGLVERGFDEASCA